MLKPVLQAAVEVMDFERGQIGNFLKQVARIENQEKLMRGKLEGIDSRFL